MKHMAAYLLLVVGGNSSPSAADVKGLLATVGVEANEERLATLVKELESKSLAELIENGKKKLFVGGGGGGGGGGAPAAAAGGAPAAAAPAAKAEKPKEEEVSFAHLTLYTKQKCMHCKYRCILLPTQRNTSLHNFATL